MSRRWKWFALAAYCVAILLVLDIVYSNVLYVPEPSLRIPDATFDHSLTPNFNGYDVWVDRIYPVRTNSLGFKDEAVRDVPLSGAGRRIVLIGDSFTEGIGLPFEETFAGLLYSAGRERADKIEFLNAGAASYSPTIYYLKIKAMLDRGLRFDEVVVFPDISDVGDEATRYFCIDPDARYRSLCNDAVAAPFVESRSRHTWLQRNFVVLDNTVRLISIMARSWSAKKEDFVEQYARHPGMRWTVSNEGDALMQPLGIEGGIERSVKNMQRLADLLASRNIPLTVVVYPWVTQLALDDRDSRQVTIWRDFCTRNCKAFVNLFPAFFDAKAAGHDWYDRLFIRGDFHFSPAGNRVIFQALQNRLFQ